jgi:hypothetical protein
LVLPCFSARALQRTRVLRLLEHALVEGEPGGKRLLRRDFSGEAEAAPRELRQLSLAAAAHGSGSASSNRASLQKVMLHGTFGSKISLAFGVYSVKPLLSTMPEHRETFPALNLNFVNRERLLERLIQSRRDHAGGVFGADELCCAER